MNRFPEIGVLKTLVEWCAPGLALAASTVFMAYLFMFLWRSIPVWHAALWPGWAVGLVTAYLGSVIVRALR